LYDYLNFTRSIGAYTGTLVNPFMYESKTDIMNNIRRWQHPLIKRSISCAHVGTFVRMQGISGVSHCGYCIPCIYRRLALMSVGLDQASNYICDVFTKLSFLTAAKQEDIRYLSRFAKQIVTASDIELRCRVVSHGLFPSNVGQSIGPTGSDNYKPWADMLKRWADDLIYRLQHNTNRETRNILGIRNISK
jgi:hypothetical protein